MPFCLILAFFLWSLCIPSSPCHFVCRCFHLKAQDWEGPLDGFEIPNAIASSTGSVHFPLSLGSISSFSIHVLTFLCFVLSCTISSNKKPFLPIDHDSIHRKKTKLKKGPKKYRIMKPILESQHLTRFDHPSLNPRNLQL